MKQALAKRKSSKSLVIAAFIAACCILTLGVAAACTAKAPVEATPPNDPETIVRIAGSEAVDTAIEASMAAFPDGLTSSDKCIVLARDDDYADSMSATGLAGAYDSPILLTDRASLSWQTLKEIRRLGAKTVLLIGGEDAVKPTVENALTWSGFDVKRVGGSDACDTSVACAKMIEEKDRACNELSTAVVATSVDFADALSVASFAYKYHLSIFITTSTDSPDGDRVLRSDAQAIIDRYNSVFVPGGPDALPMSSVEDIWGDKVTRVYGMTGYDTSVAVAQKLIDDGLLSGSSVGVANGAPDAKGMDALTASALLAKNDAPLILTEGTTNTSAAIAFIGDNSSVFDKAFVFGGVNACPKSLVNDIDKSLRDVVHYVAVLGSDAWPEKHKDVQGSDVQMLMRVDTEAAAVSLLTVPRDTYYVQRGSDFRPSYPGLTCTCSSASACTGKTWCKSNYAFHYAYYQALANGAGHSEATHAGAAKECQAISEITHVGVTKYVVCDIETVQKIVDALDGLSVDLPYALDWGAETDYLPAGEQVLDGYDFMVASRERHSYAEKYDLPEDAMRQSVNRMMLCRLIKAALNPQDIGLGGIVTTGDLLNFLVSSGFVETNISSDDVSAWSDALQANKENLVVQAASGPFEVTRYELPELGYNNEGCLQTLVDYDSAAYAAIAREFCSGERLSSGYYAETWD